MTVVMSMTVGQMDPIVQGRATDMVVRLEILGMIEVEDKVDERAEELG